MAANEGPAASPSAKKAPSSELKTRVFSAIVMIAVALFAAYQGGWIFALFWLAAGLAIMVEWTAITRIEPLRPVQVVFGLGLVALTVLLEIAASSSAFLAVGLGALAVGTLMARGAHDKLWAASGFAYAAVIVLVPPVVRAYPELGIAGLIWMFAVVWATDIAAYFTGRALGGPKLCPAISPKKTWSGFCGGVLAAALAGLLVASAARQYGLEHSFSAASAIVLSVIASIASQIGDLGESALKRHYDVKDSSHLIPGHGGVMDRLDGFWAVSLILGIVLLFVDGAA